MGVQFGNGQFPDHEERPSPRGLMKTLRYPTFQPSTVQSAQDQNSEPVATKPRSVPPPPPPGKRAGTTTQASFIAPPAPGPEELAASELPAFPPVLQPVAFIPSV